MPNIQHRNLGSFVAQLEMAVQGLQLRVRRPPLAATALANETKLEAGLTSVVHNLGTHRLAINALRSAQDVADPNEIVPGSGGTCTLRPARFDKLNEPRAVEGERVFVADRVSFQA